MIVGCFSRKVSKIGIRTLSFEIQGTLASRGPLVGSFASVNHSFTQEQVNTFAGICGDNNPLHTDPQFAEKTMFKGTIVHGILVSSLFSTLFGRSVQGAVYVSQSLKFRQPVFVNAPILARMEIKEIQKKKKGDLLICSTQCFLENGELAVDGEASVLLPYQQM